MHTVHQAHTQTSIHNTPVPSPNVFGYYYFGANDNHEKQMHEKEKMAEHMMAKEKMAEQMMEKK